MSRNQQREFICLFLFLCNNPHDIKNAAVFDFIQGANKVKVAAFSVGKRERETCQPEVKLRNSGFLLLLSIFLKFT